MTALALSAFSIIQFDLWSRANAPGRMTSQVCIRAYPLLNGTTHHASKPASKTQEQEERSMTDPL